MGEFGWGMANKRILLVTYIYKELPGEILTDVFHYEFDRNHVNNHVTETMKFATTIHDTKHRYGIRANYGTKPLSKYRCKCTSKLTHKKHEGLTIRVLSFYYIMSSILSKAYSNEHYIEDVKGDRRIVMASMVGKRRNINFVGGGDMWSSKAFANKGDSRIFWVLNSDYFRNFCDPQMMDFHISRRDAEGIEGELSELLRSMNDGYLEYLRT